MKNLFFIFFLLVLILGSSQAQNVGIGTSSPDSSAQLHIESTNKGLLMPRLTSQQRNAISKPADGLQIFNLTTGIPEVYSRGEWRPFGSSSSVQFYYDNYNDKEGYIQSDSIDYSCLINPTQKTLEISDFDSDSTGNQVFLLSYSGRQSFYGQQLYCIDGSRRFTLIKISKTGSLIWLQNFTLSNNATISSAFVRVLKDGNIMLTLNHLIGIGVTTNYNYNLGSQNFSFNNPSANIIKLSSEGQYISHRPISDTRIVFFDKNQNLFAAYVYESINGGIQKASLINCNDPQLVSIWDQQFTTHTALWSFGLHPTENNLYYTYTRTPFGSTTNTLYLDR